MGGACRPCSPCIAVSMLWARPATVGASKRRRSGTSTWKVVRTCEITWVASNECPTFQVEVPLRRLFEAPTVAGLAQSIETAMQGEQGLQAPPILPFPRDRDLPLSFAQQRLWFFDQVFPADPLYNIPFFVRLKAPLNIAALEQTLNEIVRRHEVLRTTFATVEGQPVQVIAPTLTVPLPVVDLSELAENEREAQALQLAKEEMQRSFDLTIGPSCGLQSCDLATTSTPCAGQYTIFSTTAGPLGSSSGS